MSAVPPPPPGPFRRFTSPRRHSQRELVHDLLRTGQLGSVNAGRRRLISKRHLEAFLAREE